MHSLVKPAGLSAQLNIAIGTIHNQWQKKPHKFPPITMLPGQRGPKWLQSDIDAWIQVHRRVAVPPARRVGRPTKAEQRQRALIYGGAA